MAEVKPVILASASSARRAMLTDAGVAFTVVPAEVDETAIREALTAGNAAIDPCDIAEVLARAKALSVSELNPGAIVVGADQVLACEGEIYAKAPDAAAARKALLKLRGKAHMLHSAVAIAEHGEVTWDFSATAHLTMRDFSLAFLGEYASRAGPALTSSVGAYQLEGLGLQLFERIEGDYFTILGLPLLPLLAELRHRGVIAQ
jgi:septum formation protein